MRQYLSGLSYVAMMAAILGGFSEAYAAKAPMQDSASLGEIVQVRFDPQSYQTRVAGHLTRGLCFSLMLPQEWRSTTGGTQMRLKSALFDSELVVNLRSFHELQDMAQPDLVRRDAARLQQDYENILGRPAQSVSLASLPSGVTRWSATWLDAYLPTGFTTVEAFIVPLSKDWVLELSLSGIVLKEGHDFLVRGLLANLRVQSGSGCGDQIAF